MSGEISSGFNPEVVSENDKTEISEGDLVSYLNSKTGEMDLYKVSSVEEETASIHLVTDESKLLIVDKENLRKIPKAVGRD